MFCFKPMFYLQLTFFTNYIGKCLKYFIYEYLFKFKVYTLDNLLYTTFEVVLLLALFVICYSYHSTNCMEQCFKHLFHSLVFYILKAIEYNNSVLLKLTIGGIGSVAALEWPLISIFKRLCSPFVKCIYSLHKANVLVYKLLWNEPVESYQHTMCTVSTEWHNLKWLSTVSRPINIIIKIFMYWIKPTTTK